MSFNSFKFLIFGFATVLIYYIMPKNRRWIVLLAASYVFYAFSGIQNFIFILFTTLSTFYTGILLGNTRKKYGNDKNKIKKVNRKILTGTLIINFGILLFLKYFNFFGGNINFFLNMFKSPSKIPQLSLLLPLGISFYTFQSASYIIDVYRGKYKASENIFKFALFVSYFPQIIQGPINKYDELEKQFFEPESFDWNNLKYGIQLMMFGYFKKMIIADRTAVLVDNIFGNYTEYGGFIIFFGVFMYSLQLYCDFSGGIDIAAGLSKTLGISLTENFKRPFFAVNIDDFWRRWHISLSRWMKDYLFYPISISKQFTKLGRFTRKIFGGNIGKLIPACIATIIVFLAVGMWQGPDWKFIIYGLWNGGLISLSMLLRKFFSRFNTKNFFMYLVGILRTTFLITLGRYFSRAESTSHAFAMLKRTFLYPMPSELFSDKLFNLGLDTKGIIVAGVAIVILFTISLIQEKGYSIRSVLEKRSGFVQMTAVFVMLLILVIFGIYQTGYISSEFIYGQV